MGKNAGEQKESQERNREGVSGNWTGRKKKKGGGQGGSNGWGRKRGKDIRDQEGRIGKKEV